MRSPTPRHRPRSSSSSSPAAGSGATRDSATPGRRRSRSALPARRTPPQGPTKEFVMAVDTATATKKSRLSPAGRSPRPRPAAFGSGTPSKQPGTLLKMRRAWRAYLFLSPGLLIFSVFTVFALLFGFYLTFHEWNLISQDKPFVGLQNYIDLTQDAGFLKSIVNTFYFTGASVPITMAIGFFLALLLNQAIRFKG